MSCLALDLVPNILLRLPVSSVLRFGCVCKSWYRLIRSPHFVSSYCLGNTQQQQFLVHKFSICCGGDDEGTSSLIFFGGDYFQSLSKEFQLPDGYSKVAGSCNGLICLAHSYKSYLLLNPSINHSVCLPDPHSETGHRHNLMGFGFDDAANDYKIIRFYSSAEIYSFNSNRWRDIPVPIPDFQYVYNKVGAFVNGALHWVVTIDGEGVVLVFDVKAETFRQFSLPSTICPSRGTNVFGYGGTSIAVAHQCRIIMMKEYGVTESWEHLATVGKQLGPYLEVLGFRDKDQVFVIVTFGSDGSSPLASKKFNGEIDWNLMSVGKGEVLTLHEYVPSLFLLDKHNCARALV